METTDVDEAPAVDGNSDVLPIVICRTRSLGWGEVVASQGVLDEDIELVFEVTNIGLGGRPGSLQAGGARAVTRTSELGGLVGHENRGRPRWEGTDLTPNAGCDKGKTQESQVTVRHSALCTARVVSRLTDRA